MSPRSLFYVLSTVVILLVWSSTAAAQSSNMLLSPEQRLDTAVVLLEAGQAKRFHAMDMLLKVPGDLVVPRLIEELDRNARLRDPARRRMVYVALSLRLAHSDSGLVDLLLNGLADSNVSDICLNSFRNVPDNQRPLYVAVFIDRLNSGFTKSDYISATIINLLLDYGSVSIPALGALGRVLRTTDEGLAANRVGAGLAISEVGGIEAALAEYYNLDSTGLKGALVGLSNLGLQSDGQFDKDSSHIKSARQVVLDALKSTSVGAVTYATDAIYGVFGTDLYTPDLALNPQVKLPLISAAEETSDSDIRQILISTLRRLDEGPTDH